MSVQPYWRRERGGSIYSHGSKTSRLTKNHVENRLNRPLTGQQTVCQSDWQTDWQTDLQAGQTGQDRLNRPLTSWTGLDQRVLERKPSSAALGQVQLGMVREVHSWSWSSAGVESSTQLKSSSAEKLSCSWRSSSQLKLSSAGKLSCSWRSSAVFQQEHSRFLNPNHGQPNNVNVIFGFQK